MIPWLVAAALAQDPGLLRIDPPVAGVETTITLVDDLERGEPGATVQVVHRPGLGGERTRAIGITDSRGRVRWVPEAGGVALVRAGDHSARVAIGWPEPPAATTTLLFLLAVVAAGFTGYGALPRRSPRRSEAR